MTKTTETETGTEIVVTNNAVMILSPIPKENKLDVGAVGNGNGTQPKSLILGTIAHRKIQNLEPNLQLGEIMPAQGIVEYIEKLQQKAQEKVVNRTYALLQGVDSDQRESFIYQIKALFIAKDNIDPKQINVDETQKIITQLANQFCPDVRFVEALQQVISDPKIEIDWPAINPGEDILNDDDFDFISEFLNLERQSGIPAPQEIKEIIEQIIKPMVDNESYIEQRKYSKSLKLAEKYFSKVVDPKIATAQTLNTFLKNLSESQKSQLNQAFSEGNVNDKVSERIDSATRLTREAIISLSGQPIEEIAELSGIFIPQTKSRIIEFINMSEEEAIKSGAVTLRSKNSVQNNLELLAKSIETGVIMPKTDIIKKILQIRSSEEYQFRKITLTEYQNISKGHHLIDDLLELAMNNQLSTKQLDDFIKIANIVSQLRDEGAYADAKKSLKEDSIKDILSKSIKLSDQVLQRPEQLLVELITALKEKKQPSEEGLSKEQPITFEQLHELSEIIPNSKWKDLSEWEKMIKIFTTAKIFIDLDPKQIKKFLIDKIDELPEKLEKLIFRTTAIPDLITIVPNEALPQDGLSSESDDKPNYESETLHRYGLMDLNRLSLKEISQLKVILQEAIKENITINLTEIKTDTSVVGSRSITKDLRDLAHTVITWAKWAEEILNYGSKERVNIWQLIKLVNPILTQVPLKTIHGDELTPMGIIDESDIVLVQPFEKGIQNKSIDGVKAIYGDHKIENTLVKKLFFDFLRDAYRHSIKAKLES